MSATLSTLPSAESVEPPAARLALKTEGGARGLLDGAWWPRSRDLLIELPELTRVLDSRWGRITRVAVNPQYWPVIPHKVPVNGHVVKVGWFTPEIDAHKLLLLSYGTGRWDLLIIPPETDAESAAWLMAAASDRDGPPLTASALVEACRDRPGVATTEGMPNPAEAWDEDGGASARPPAVAVQTGHVDRAPTGAEPAGVDARPGRLIVGL
ncbi:DUF5994 family protein [Streptomyces sp. NPDC057094]|uniref:DUF5994 family protein n=1 Tax=unclassified Streptomyces TaxID=2593676 RepID=UPI0036334BDD